MQNRSRTTGAMPQYTTCLLNADTAIELYQPADDPDSVSILLGQEQLRLDCSEPEVLERLIAAAREGLRKLRASTCGQKGTG